MFSSVPISACKLLTKLADAEMIGPVLMGMTRPVHLLPRGAEVEEIVKVAAIAVVEAQETKSSVFEATAPVAAIA